MVVCGSVLCISGTPRSTAAASQLQLPHGVTGKLQIDKTGAFCGHLQDKPPLHSKPHISATHMAWVFVLYPIIGAANECSSLGVSPDLLWYSNYGHSGSLGSITGTADTLWTEEEECSWTAVKSTVYRIYSFSAIQKALKANRKCSPV